MEDGMLQPSIASLMEAVSTAEKEVAALEANYSPMKKEAILSALDKADKALFALSKFYEARREEVQERVWAVMQERLASQEFLREPAESARV